MVIPISLLWCRSVDVSILSVSLQRAGVVDISRVRNNSDAVETATFETVTETWLKLEDRDRDFIKNSETESRDLKIETETRDFKICGFCGN